MERRVIVNVVEFSPFYLGGKKNRKKENRKKTDKRKTTIVRCMLAYVAQPPLKRIEKKDKKKTEKKKEKDAWVIVQFNSYFVGGMIGFIVSKSKD